MRTVSRTLAVLFTTGVVGSAWAQPLDPYANPEPPAVAPPVAAPPAVAPPSTTTRTQTTTTSTTVSTTTTLPAQPIDPYVNPAPAAPPPPAVNPWGYQPPAPPQYVPPGPPAYQRGYYLYPTQPSYPVYYAPRTFTQQGCCAYGCARSCSYPMVSRPGMQVERIRRFSLGVHGIVMGINQTVGGNDMVMGGAGFQLRIRSKGRFGLELAQSFLRGDQLNGDFVRNSYPFTFGLMFYVFPNQDTRHFNLYGIAGVGAMLDSVDLRHPRTGDMVTQDFLEWLAYVGVGAELRFKWFALAADARFIGLWRDDNTTPAAYYSGVDGGPIPSSSYGYQGRVFMNFWF